MPLHIESNFDEVLVTNHTMRPENYAEKWNRVERLEGQKYRKAFYAWHQASVDTFERLAGANNQGMDNVFAALSGAFGQRPVLAAKDRIIKSLNANRDNGNLGVALGTGAITAAITGKAHSASRVVTPVVPVKRNQFYGD